MEKNEKPDKGVFTWGAFTAIIIIVVCAAVLVFFFKVKLGGEETNTANKNVINETMIDRGYIRTDNGTSIEIKNETKEENTTNETTTNETTNEVTNEVSNEVTNEVTNEVVENTVVE